MRSASRFSPAPRSAAALAARAAVLAAVTLAVAAARGAAQGPGQRCDLQLENTTNTRLSAVRAASGNYDYYAGGGVLARCAGQEITLRADSAESYTDRSVLYLIGNVHYVEPRVRVDSRRMTYFRADERLVAEGDVFAVLPTGTTMRGPQATYHRAVVGIRPRARLEAPGRPQMAIVQLDSLGRKSEPVGLVANRILSEADSLVYASGNVEITRSDLDARSDSAFLDSGREFARLMRQPVIKGKGERPFTLSGEVVDLYSRERVLQRVVSTRAAKVTSEDLNLASDTIDMRLDANKLQRVYAWGGSQARVTAPDRDMIADSMDVLMPGQRVRQVRAIGHAYAATAPDTLRIRSPERDWIRGDTIFAFFDSTAVADTGGRPRLTELRSNGSASSRYQVASQQGGPTRPAINYVRGRQITVAMREQDVGVGTVTVRDQAAGVFLEPAVAADSSADSVAATGAGRAASGRAADSSAARPAGGAARPATPTPQPAAGGTTRPPTKARPKPPTAPLAPEPGRSR